MKNKMLFSKYTLSFPFMMSLVGLFGCGPQLPSDLKDRPPVVDANKAAEMPKDRSKTVTESYLGNDRQPVVDKLGVHSKVMVFNERGKKTSEAYYDLNGQPARDAQGIHKKVWVYDSNGYKSKEEYFGLKDEPVTDKNGIHCREWTTITTLEASKDVNQSDNENETE
jgi:hypothetical protein